jgi:hypothetical protein
MLARELFRAATWRFMSFAQKIAYSVIDDHQRDTPAQESNGLSKLPNRPEGDCSGPSDCSSKPLVSYQINRQFSGWCDTRLRGAPYGNYLLKALAKLDLMLPDRELGEP